MNIWALRGYTSLLPAGHAAGRGKRKFHLLRLSIPIPKPLRSDTEPLGFSTLEGLDRIRVEAANTVYFNTCELIRWANSFNIPCSLENPANSIFWLIPFVAKLLEDLGGYDNNFHNCCHGGLRKKLTRLWETHNLFSDLALLCQDDHPHLDWKPEFDEQKKNSSGIKYPTSDEAAYPFLLCQRLIAAVKKNFWSTVHLNPSSFVNKLNMSKQILTNLCWACFHVARNIVNLFQSFPSTLTQSYGQGTKRH